MKWSALGRGNDTASIGEQAAFEILSNKRRRFTLHALKQYGALTLGRLADLIAAWEEEVSVKRLDSSSRKSVYTSLQQSHLPKMDEAGIVEYDQRAGHVEPTPAAEELDVYMEVIEGREVPWHGYYLGLSAVGLSLLVALATDTAPFTALPDIAWFSFLVAALLVSALVHTIARRRRQLGTDKRPPEVR